MKKLIFAALCIMLTVSAIPGCDSIETTVDEPEHSGSVVDPARINSPSINETSLFNIVGQFYCSSNYCRKLTYLESIPSITFFESGDCVLFINYLEGGCDMNGKYSIDGNKIYVNLDFTGTIFENTGTEYTDTDFMADKYIFTIQDSNTVTINRACYAAEKGDSFVRKEFWPGFIK